LLSLGRRVNYCTHFSYCVGNLLYPDSVYGKDEHHGDRGVEAVVTVALIGNNLVRLIITIIIKRL